MNLIKSFKPTTLKSLFFVYKKVKEVSNKKFILFDILYCSFKYQTAFHDYLEFEFYSLNSKERKTYLTHGKNNTIIRTFNDKNYWHILENKDEFNDYFRKYLKRDYLKPNFNLDELDKFLKNKKNVIVKPVDGIGGKGIKIVKADKELLKQYNNYLIEEVINQHPLLNELYDKSVNSIRIFTFYDGKKSYFLQAILKIGNNGVIDNFSSGGMYTFLDDNGVVITPAIDANDNIYEFHPISNKKIVGYKVPLFKEAIDMVLDAAREIKEIKYIGWDVAISKDGPCIIEGNSYPGIFQMKPRFSKDKIGLIPKYEKIMKIKL